MSEIGARERLRVWAAALGLVKVELFFLFRGFWKVRVTTIARAAGEWSVVVRGGDAGGNADFQSDSRLR